MFNLTDVKSGTQGIKCGEMFTISDGYSTICAFCRAEHNSFYNLAEHVFDHLLKRAIPIEHENINSSCESISVGRNIEAQTSGNKKKEPTKNSKSDHQCSFCDKKFSKTKALLEHEHIHTGKMPYECQECLKPFSTLKSLRVHGITHKEIDRQMCADCGRTFNNTGTLNIHIRERHLPDTDKRRLFPCRYCDNKFKTNHQLFSHLRTHKKTNETFTCDHCQREFKSKRLIFAHMDNVHSKLHTCSVCSKAFRHKAHRDDHENIHTGHRPYQCQFCPKEFMNKAGLTRHNKIHADNGSKIMLPSIEIERKKSNRKYKFVCKLCSKAFPYKAARDDHENVHTGHRPHKCRFCEKDYSTKRTLKYHIKNAHTNDEARTLNSAKEI